jgi:hypothetical protein
VDSPTGRLYLTPHGAFPSVTTILGSQPKQWVLDWRAAVGEEEADRVMMRASRRGTALHSAMEEYVTGRITPEYEFDEPSVKDSFLTLKPVVDAGLTRVYGSEVFMYSRHLRVAGTCDLVGEWYGDDAIIDFKNLGNLKHEEEVEDYFIQETAYSIMVQEHTGRVHDKLVLVLAFSGALPQVFVRKRDSELVDKLLKIRDCYERMCCDAATIDYPGDVTVHG